MSTHVQATVSAVLEELRFENLGAEMSGSPARFKPNQGTVDLIQSLVDKGKAVTVDSSGTA